MARSALLSFVLAACVASVAALDVLLYVTDLDSVTNKFKITADTTVPISAFQFDVVDQGRDPNKNGWTNEWMNERTLLSTYSKA